MKEIWKDIIGFEGYYQVSSKGRVKSVKRVLTMRNQVTTWQQEKPEVILSLGKDSKGYFHVRLSPAGCNPRTARVHRLVAEVFLPPPSEELIKNCKNIGYILINHKDGNKENNCVDNLEWCNVAYNNSQSWRGNKRTSNNIQGRNHYMSTLKEEDVQNIVKEYSSGGITQKALAMKYKVKQITISNIMTGKSWRWLTGISNSRKNYKKKTELVDCH